MKKYEWTKDVVVEGVAFRAGDVVTEADVPHGSLSSALKTGLLREYAGPGIRRALPPTLTTAAVPPPRASEAALANPPPHATPHAAASPPVPTHSALVLPAGWDVGPPQQVKPGATPVSPAAVPTPPTPPTPDEIPERPPEGVLRGGLPGDTPHVPEPLAVDAEDAKTEPKPDAGGKGRKGK